MARGWTGPPTGRLTWGAGWGRVLPGEPPHRGDGLGCRLGGEFLRDRHPKVGLVDTPTLGCCRGCSRPLNEHPKVGVSAPPKPAPQNTLQMTPQRCRSRGGLRGGANPPISTLSWGGSDGTEPTSEPPQPQGVRRPTAGLHRIHRRGALGPRTGALPRGGGGESARLEHEMISSSPHRPPPGCGHPPATPHLGHGRDVAGNRFGGVVPYAERPRRGGGFAAARGGTPRAPFGRIAAEPAGGLVVRSWGPRNRPTARAVIDQKSTSGAG